VPFDDCPNLGVGRPYSSSPLYSWPALFLVSHAGVPLGLARSALDFTEELMARKDLTPGRSMRDDSQVQETIAMAEATIEAARCYVYGTLESLWATLCAGEKPSPRQRAHYRLMMTHAHQAAKQVIVTLYDLAATSAIFRSSPLDRNMRDILTSSQHRVVHPKMYRPAGRLILGLDPLELFF
jgi:indole-3-acetate monooxygenase